MPENQPQWSERENAKEDLAYRTPGTLVDLCVGDPPIVPLPDGPVVQHGIQAHPEETDEEKPDIVLKSAQIKGIHQQVPAKQENKRKTVVVIHRRIRQSPKRLIASSFSGERIGKFIAEGGADADDCQDGRVDRKDTHIRRRIEPGDDRCRDDPDQLGSRCCPRTARPRAGYSRCN